MSAVVTGPAHATRGRPRSAAADSAILDAARSILVADGYGGLTMAGVAQRAGVSTATLYRRFQHREDLVVAAVAGHDESSPTPDTGNLGDDVRMIVRDTVRTFRSERGALILAFLGEATRNPALSETLRVRLVSTRRAELREVFIRAAERGEIELPAAVDVVVDLLGGPLFYRLVVTGQPITERVGDDLAALVLAAVGWSA